MNPHVPVQVALLCESLPAEEAHEQLVHLEVVGVVFQLSENTGAFGALVVPLWGLVVASLVGAVFLIGRGSWRGTERIIGHARRQGYIAAPTVHSGVNE